MALAMRDVGSTYPAHPIASGRPLVLAVINGPPQVTLTLPLTLALAPILTPTPTPTPTRTPTPTLTLTLTLTQASPPRRRTLQRPHPSSHESYRPPQHTALPGSWPLPVANGGVQPLP